MYISRDKLHQWKRSLRTFDYHQYAKDHLPLVHRLLFTGKDEHVPLKRIVGFIYGLVLGLAFYHLVLTDLNYNDRTGLLLTTVICTLMSLGNALSSQIRCITLLTFPNVGGRAGRGVLKALVLAYIITGPIQNLSGNGREVVRVFGCTASLTYNLTKTRFELMFKPFAHALFGMRADLHEVKDTIRSVRDLTAPIVGEFENEGEMRKMREENDYVDAAQGDSQRTRELERKYEVRTNTAEAQRYEHLYLEKVELKCEQQFSKAATRCRSGFAAAYDKCDDVVGWMASWLLCWPMKLTFVCNIAQALGGPGKCDPRKDLDPGFGEGYARLKHSRHALADNFNDVKLQYAIPRVDHVVDYQDATDTAKAIMHDVETKKSLLDTLLGLFQKLLAFAFLRIIISAQSYHDRYLRDLEFDNIYVTAYFKRIDARRRARAQHTLLPLKKVERLQLVEPWSCMPLKREREELLGQTVKLLLEVITATTFVLLDRLFFEALDIVRRHAQIEYFQRGHHDLSLEVTGTGLIASILRSVVKGFNVKQRIKTVRSNAACLPQPTPLPAHFLLKIYGTYALIWLLILGHAYIARLNRAICAYFYRKREKRRVLFVYNETLKRRVGFMRHMRRKVKKLARERRLQENLNVLQVLRRRFPRWCDCLRVFALAQRSCIVCKEVETGKVDGFVECATANCYVVYCAECWTDMGRQCFACAEELSDSSDCRDSD